MPAPRKRYADSGKPLSCAVKIPAVLAQVLYRERIKGRYRDETELVVSIIREWAAKLEQVDWTSVLADLKKEEEAAAQQSAAPPKKKPKP